MTTATVAKAFDTYFRESFWDEFNGEPAAKKMKTNGAELNSEETMHLVLAAVDYYILNDPNDVLGDDEARTAFVLKIIEMAKTMKGQHGDAFDGEAIAKAFRAMH